MSTFSEVFTKSFPWMQEIGGEVRLSILEMPDTSAEPISFGRTFEREYAFLQHDFWRQVEQQDPELFAAREQYVLRYQEMPAELAAKMKYAPTPGIRTWIVGLTKKDVV